MKVHRIITTIEVENDNSITSVELTKLYSADVNIPLAITNLTTNGNANDINKVYAVVDKLRIVINGELKSIARGINTALTQSGVRGESPTEPDGTNKTSQASKLMATVACNSSHRMTHDVELSYTNINNANSHG